MLGVAMALGCALTWAISVILFRSTPRLTPFAMNLFKNVASIGLFLVTLPLLGAEIVWDRPALEWAALIASGVLGIAIADTLFFTALQRLGPSRLAIVECIYSPLIVALSALFLAEPVTPALFAGAGLVALGVGVGSTERRPEGPVDLRGVAIGAIAIVVLALGVLLARPVLEHREVAEVTLIRLLSGVVGQLLWSLLRGLPREDFAAFRSTDGWRTLVPAAILGTWLSMLLWMGGFKYAPVSVAAVLNQTTIVWVLLLSWIFLGERLSPRRGLGASLAAAGALLVVLTRPA